MYADHVPLIAQFAAEKPANLFRVGLFVQATINQHLEMVPGIIESFDRYNFRTPYLMGWQKRSITTLLDEQERLHAALLQWKKRGKGAAHHAIRDIVELPGFGIVKGAFFAQLVLPYTQVGCLDRHNLRLAGLSERAFSHIPASAEGLTRKINMYLALCTELGGGETLWNRWCRHIAQLRPTVFADAQAVSQLHVDCIVR